MPLRLLQRKEPAGLGDSCLPGQAGVKMWGCGDSWDRRHWPHLRHGLWAPRLLRGERGPALSLAVPLCLLILWGLVSGFQGFPGGTSGKELACQCRRHKRGGFNPWVGKSPWRRAWQPTLIFLQATVHGVAQGQTRQKPLSMHTSSLWFPEPQAQPASSLPLPWACVPSSCSCPAFDQPGSKQSPWALWGAYLWKNNTEIKQAWIHKENNN